jgi:sterol desaturase/sphingolipid hydroxylase (fatty acid hydroxylase superfamily)
MNTSIAHNMHHRYFKGNYGLYFLVWDRLIGTLNENYDKAFEEIGARPREVKTKIEKHESKADGITSANHLHQ